MLNDAHISFTGYVATQPVTKEVGPGNTNLSMRVAWTPRRIDRATGEWVDGNTSFVTVTCWRKLAENAAICLRKGDPVLVLGRLSVRYYADKAGVPRTAVDVEASSVGHDMCRGVAQFQRVRPKTGMTAAEYARAVADGADGLPRDADGGSDDGGLAELAGVAASSGLAEALAQTEPPASELADGMFDDAAVAGLAEGAEPAAAPF